MTKQRIIIADDHPLFRDALTLSLKGAVPGVQIDEAGSFDELVAALADRRETDLVLLDLTMPGIQGLSGLLFLRAEHPQIPVIVVSATEDPKTIRRCMDCGASGFVPKSVPDLRIREAIGAVLGGQLWVPDGFEAATGDAETTEMIARIATLTPQQIRVLMMLDDEGISNKLIAHRFGVKEATIKAHVSEILKKLNVDNRTQASNAFKKVSSLDWQKARI